MVLVDTSVWVDHFRQGDHRLGQLLQQGLVSIHPMVIGELACGHMHNRSQVLELLRNLPSSATASEEEALYFLEKHSLMGKGVGWVDMHLLAGCTLTPNCQLWTRDKRLHGIALALRLAFLEN